MKRKWIVAAVVSAVLLGMAVLCPAGETADVPPRLKPLDRIAAMEGRIEGLSSRVVELERRVNELALAHEEGRVAGQGRHGPKYASPNDGAEAIRASTEVPATGVLGLGDLPTKGQLERLTAAQRGRLVELLIGKSLRFRARLRSVSKEHGKFCLTFSVRRGKADPRFAYEAGTTTYQISVRTDDKRALRLKRNQQISCIGEIVDIRLGGRTRITMTAASVNGEATH